MAENLSTPFGPGSTNFARTAKLGVVAAKLKNYARSCALRFVPRRLLRRRGFSFPRARRSRCPRRQVARRHRRTPSVSRAANSPTPQLGERFNFPVHVVKTAEFNNPSISPTQRTAATSANTNCSRSLNPRPRRNLPSFVTAKTPAIIGDFPSRRESRRRVSSPCPAEGSRFDQGRHPRIVRATRPPPPDKPQMACLSSHPVRRSWSRRKNFA